MACDDAEDWGAVSCNGAEKWSAVTWIDDEGCGEATWVALVPRSEVERKALNGPERNEEVI